MVLMGTLYLLLYIGLCSATSNRMDLTFMMVPTKPHNYVKLTPNLTNLLYYILLVLGKKR